MNKLKFLCLASLLTAGIAQASTPCDGFEIKIKNKLADDLLVRKIRLQGAEIQPGGLQKINGHTEAVFTVSNSAADNLMTGELIFDTITLPTKEVKVQFNLTNKGLICEHDDHTPASDLPVDKTRLPGKVVYTIG